MTRSARSDWNELKCRYNEWPILISFARTVLPLSLYMRLTSCYNHWTITKRIKTANAHTISDLLQRLRASGAQRGLTEPCSFAEWSTTQSVRSWSCPITMVGLWLPWYISTESSTSAAQYIQNPRGEPGLTPEAAQSMNYVSTSLPKVLYQSSIACRFERIWKSVVIFPLMMASDRAIPSANIIFYYPLCSFLSTYACW